MKKIATFLKEPGKDDYPLSKEDYRQSYFELSKVVSSRGLEFYIVRGQETYQGNGQFSQSWVFDENRNLVEKGPLTADVIFDRGEFKHDETVPMFNPARMNEICTDKWLMYTLFKELCPLTIKVNSQLELAPALDQVKTDLAVVKPIDGQEGEGVHIEPKADLLKLELSYPVLVQEFLDSSFGVPGIVEGLHDLRIAMFNGEILYSYFRTPPKGSYLANVARGGRFDMIDITKLPQPVLQLVKDIDAQFSNLPHRFYGIDFAYTANGPKIIEMNSRLGLLPNQDDPAFVTLKERIADTLLALATT